MEPQPPSKLHSPAAAGRACRRRRDGGGDARAAPAADEPLPNIEIMICPVCREPRAEDARFCEECGHDYGGEAAAACRGERPTSRVRPSGRSCCSGRPWRSAGCSSCTTRSGPSRRGRREADGPGGAGRPRVFEIQGPMTLIGRAPDCDVLVFDAQVSRHHAQVIHQGTEYHVQSLQQSNPDRQRPGRDGPAAAGGRRPDRRRRRGAGSRHPADHGDRRPTRRRTLRRRSRSGGRRARRRCRRRRPASGSAVARAWPPPASACRRAPRPSRAPAR